MTDKLAKAADRFSETVIDDEIVVMSLQNGDFFSLTGTAKAIWQLIDGTRDRPTIAAELGARFGCAPAEIAADIDAFIAQLDGAGLLAAA